MYCKYCGNEIDDNSTFCNHCGKPLDSNLSINYNLHAWVIYIIWALANMYLLMGDKHNDASSFFYPFTSHSIIFTALEKVDIEFGSWDKDFYDFSEFIVYVFIIPAIVYYFYKNNKVQSDDVAETDSTTEPSL